MNLPLFDDQLVSGEIGPEAPRTPGSDKPRAWPKETRIVAAGKQIGSDPATGDDIAFMHTTMCQVGLPRRAVQSDRFERRSGKAILVVQAGEVFDGETMVPQSIPYGPYPRLMLALMNTYAVSNNTPAIPIRDNPSQYLREELGKPTNGGKRSASQMFWKQFVPFVVCRMTLGFQNNEGKATTSKVDPIQTIEAWESDLGSRTWPETLILTDRYFKMLKEHAVPLDVRALRALKGSSLSMDIYCWLAQRLFAVNRNVFVPWARLREQFGQEYVGTHGAKDFRTAFLVALRDALTVYPKASVKVKGGVGGGLWLHPSPPPIPSKAG
jgi:Plasmid encoded RepA protein